MAAHESTARSDEWYTPAWIFEALSVKFDLDPCAAPDGKAPASRWVRHEIFGSGGLEFDWYGTVWLNPPFGRRNGIKSWLDKLVAHGNGIAIVPNRTGADWWQDAVVAADAVLFVRKKIRFLRPDGSEGGSPGYGNVLMAYGSDMARALLDSKIPGKKFPTERTE